MARMSDAKTDEIEAANARSAEEAREFIISTALQYAYFIPESCGDGETQLIPFPTGMLRGLLEAALIEREGK